MRLTPERKNFKWMRLGWRVNKSGTADAVVAFVSCQ